MAQRVTPATRRAFRRVYAELTTYDRETTAGDRETPPRRRLRKQRPPAPRQSRFDKTDRSHLPFVIFHLSFVIVSLLPRGSHQNPAARNGAPRESSLRFAAAAVPVEVSAARSTPLVPAAKAALIARPQSNDQSQLAPPLLIRQNPSDNPLNPWFRRDAPTTRASS